MTKHIPTCVDENDDTNFLIASVLIAIELGFLKLSVLTWCIIISNRCTVKKPIRKYMMLLICLFLVDLDQSLLSFERLDRASPDLWPEQSRNNFSHYTA